MHINYLNEHLSLLASLLDMLAAYHSHIEDAADDDDDADEDRPRTTTKTTPKKTTKTHVMF